MSYQITITKRQEVTEKRGQDWAKIAVKGGNEEYGYTPEIEKTVTRDTEILKQSVDELDLAAVIKAINKL